jgi:hypothetical protein
MREFGIQLAVVDNGFVYVGEVLLDGDYYVISRCKNVRRSGTTKGFGQLAFEGPLKETALDPCPPVMVPAARMCHLIECADVWKTKL